MESVKKEAPDLFLVGRDTPIWVGVLRASQRTPSGDQLEAITKLPDVVTIFVLSPFVFTKWLWRLPVFRGWLVPCRTYKERGRGFAEHMG